MRAKTMSERDFDEKRIGDRIRRCPERMGYRWKGGRGRRERTEAGKNGYWPKAGEVGSRASKNDSSPKTGENEARTKAEEDGSWTKRAVMEAG